MTTRRVLNAATQSMKAASAAAKEFGERFNKQSGGFRRAKEETEGADALMAGTEGGWLREGASARMRSSPSETENMAQKPPAKKRPRMPTDKELHSMSDKELHSMSDKELTEKMDELKEFDGPQTAADWVRLFDARNVRRLNDKHIRQWRIARRIYGDDPEP